ncbi:hypothetical protein U1Q18_051565 [Sarracenia purpurea var. burkii]
MSRRVRGRSCGGVDGSIDVFQPNRRHRMRDGLEIEQNDVVLPNNIQPQVVNNVDEHEIPAIDEAGEHVGEVVNNDILEVIPQDVIAPVNPPIVEIDVMIDVD